MFLSRIWKKKSGHGSFIVLTAASFLAALLLFSCAGKPDALVEETAPASHFFWTISDDTSEDGGIIHIFGSIHFALPEVYPLPEPVYTSFDQSELLFLEIDLAEADAEAVAAAQPLMGYDDGSQLNDYLNDEEEALISAALGRMSIPLEMVQQYKPWVIESMLIAGIADQQGIKAEHGIDYHFSARAAEQNIPVQGLETLEQQLLMLGSLDTHTQAAELVMTAESYQDIGTYLNELISIWMDGDAPAMESLLLDAFLESPELEPYYEVMLAERNRAWVEILKNRIAEAGTSFVVVGTAHLVGPENVIQLMQEAGYRVERH